MLVLAALAAAPAAAAPATCAKPINGKGEIHGKTYQSDCINDTTDPFDLAVSGNFGKADTVLLQLRSPSQLSFQLDPKDPAAIAVVPNAWSDPIMWDKSYNDHAIRILPYGAVEISATSTLALWYITRQPAQVVAQPTPTNTAGQLVAQSQVENQTIDIADATALAKIKLHDGDELEWSFAKSATPITLTLSSDKPSYPFSLIHASSGTAQFQSKIWSKSKGHEIRTQVPSDHGTLNSGPAVISISVEAPAGTTDQLNLKITRAAQPATSAGSNATVPNGDLPNTGWADLGGLMQLGDSATNQTTGMNAFITFPLSATQRWVVGGLAALLAIGLLARRRRASKAR